jgi:hypothetical protein
LIAEQATHHRELSTAMQALQRDLRTKLQAVTAALQRLDAQDQQVASEASASLQKQVRLAFRLLIFSTH